MVLRKDRPQVAIVGAGYWGRNLIRNFYALGAVKLVVERDPQTLAGALEAHPGLEGTDDLAEVWADEDIKGVVIATPADAHIELAREALNRDRDVFVEKPLGLSFQEGDELRKQAEEQNRILMVGHILWYHPALLKLKELIDQGLLGKIAYIYSNRLSMGKIRTEENALWSLAPHDLSMILGLAGQMPEKVGAFGGNFVQPRLADWVVTQLDFPSGLKAQIMVSWLHPFKEQKLVVVGHEKMAVFDDTAPWEAKLKLYANRVNWRHQLPEALKGEAEAVPLDELEPLKQEARAFLKAMMTRQPPYTSGAEGLRVLKVLEMSQKALETGRPVRAGGPAKPGCFVHETAVVDPGARIGAGTKIWHFSHILGDTVLGENCNLGQNVVVGPRVTVGRACKIQNNVSVYEGVTLEDEVFCGPSMVFTNIVNPRAGISRRGEIKPTRLRRGATVGANATIVCGHDLGQYCFIGAGSVITRDVPAHALMVGSPARRVGWVCQCGVKLADDLACPACGKTYRPEGEGLARKT